MASSERRGNTRANISLPIKYRFVNQLALTWYPATLVNISAGGIRFQSEQPLDPGTRLECEITLPVRPEPYLLTGEVVWNKTFSLSQSESGLAFVDVTPERQFDIDELVQFLLKPPGKDQG